MIDKRGDGFNSRMECTCSFGNIFMANGIKRCAVCGGEARVDKMSYGGFLRDDEWRVICTSCGKETGWIPCEYDAIKKWNSDRPKVRNANSPKAVIQSAR